jgi:transposase InsO family protein
VNHEPGDTTVARSGGNKVAVGSTPDPEVAALPKRRQFSAAYMRRIVRAATACQARLRTHRRHLRQDIARGQLTLHADRGTSMRSKPVALLLVDLGVTKSHSRPHVSDDNPYSEAQFKTLKYQPNFPARFDSIEHARAFCRGMCSKPTTSDQHGWQEPPAGSTTFP